MKLRFRAGYSSLRVLSAKEKQESSCALLQEMYPCWGRLRFLLLHKPLGTGTWAHLCRPQFLEHNGVCVINPSSAGAGVVREAAPGVLASQCVNHPAANLLEWGQGSRVGRRCSRGPVSTRSSNISNVAPPLCT